MVIADEFNRTIDALEFVCVRCGHPFSEYDLGGHLSGQITDRRFNLIGIDGDICVECLHCMWEFSEGGLDGAKRRLTLSINLTKQAVDGRYTPDTSTSGNP